MPTAITKDHRDCHFLGFARFHSFTCRRALSARCYHRCLAVGCPNVLFLTKDESNAYLRGLQRGVERLGIDVTTLTTLASAERSITAIVALTIPGNVRVRPFSHAIQELLGSLKTSRLILINEFGIWPSSEDLYQYYTIRKANNDFGDLGNSPGHLFGALETEKFFTFLGMALDFGWGGIIAGEGDEISMSFNHDGRVAILFHHSNEGRGLELLKKLKIDCDLVYRLQ